MPHINSDPWKAILISDEEMFNEKILLETKRDACIIKRIEKNVFMFSALLGH